MPACTATAVHAHSCVGEQRPTAMAARVRGRRCCTLYTASTLAPTKLCAADPTCFGGAHTCESCCSTGERVFVRAGMSHVVPILTAVYAVWRSGARLYTGVGTDGSSCWGGVYSKERCCFNVSTAAPTKATPAPTLDGIASALLMPSMNSRSKPGRVLRCSLRCRFCDVACPRASELPEPLENAAA